MVSLRLMDILGYISSNKIVYVLRLKAVFDLGHDLPDAMAQVAEMITGGMVICSTCERNGQYDIYAQTVIQIDGDVVTAFPPDVIENPDFEALAEQHIAEVANALEPLAKLATHLRRVQWAFRSIVAIVGLISAIFSFKNCWYLLGFLLSAFLLVLGLLAHKILLKIVGRQVHRLTDLAKREAEAHANKILKKVQDPPLGTS